MNKVEEFTFHYDKELKPVYHKNKHTFDVDLIIQDVMPKVTMTLKIDRLTADKDSQESYKAYIHPHGISCKHLHRQEDRPPKS